MILDLEREFGVSLPQATLNNVRTVGDLADCVFSQLHEGSLPRERQRIGARVVEMVTEQLGLDPGQVTERSRFVEDLNVR
jgi:acyl carrier protein